MAGRAALVLLHALPLDARMWRAQAASLSGTGTIIAPNLPGFGDEQASAEPPSLDDWARRLSASLRAAGVNKAVVAGCSMGGYTGLALLRVDPGLLAGLALVNSRAAPDSTQQRDARMATIDLVKREGTAFMVESAPLALSPSTRDDKPEVVASVRAMAADAPAASIIAAHRAIAARPDMRDALVRTHVPVAVIAGVDDPIVPLDEARLLAASIRGATFTPVPHAGHISPMEHPGVVTGALHAFWERC